MEINEETERFILLVDNGDGTTTMHANLQEGDMGYISGVMMADFEGMLDLVPAENHEEIRERTLEKLVAIPTDLEE